MLIRQETLVRSSNKIAAYIENYVTRANPEKKEEILQLFDNLQALFPSYVVATCPLLHPEIHYVSTNVLHVLGYSREYLIDNSNMEKYVFHVHEADQENGCPKRPPEDDRPAVLRVDQPRNRAAKAPEECGEEDEQEADALFAARNSRLAVGGFSHGAKVNEFPSLRCAKGDAALRESA